MIISKKRGQSGHYLLHLILSGTPVILLEFAI